MTMPAISELARNNENILTPIQQFYSGANIFITGATGFLGQILVEKLLRSCPELSSLYVLVRNKKGKSAHERLDELFDDVVFDRLKSEQPKFRHKVIAVGGDCGLPELGLSMQDRQMLINEVNIVFHVAATVRFDEKLKLAVAINVRSVQEIISLCKEMLNLKSVIHVSSAFAHCELANIEERLYTSPISYKKLLTLVDISTDSFLDKVTPIILDKWPNTYTYTKTVAEDVVNSEGNGLPIAVYRPAIVISSYQEPLEGWINNMYGPVGVGVGVSVGILHSLHCNPKLNANLVPVDMCVNSLIAMAWEVGDTYAEYRESKTSFEIPVYHFEASTDQPITWGSFWDKCLQHGPSMGLTKSVWHYYFIFQPTVIGYTIVILLTHYLPAILVDTTLICLGRKPKLLKAYKKIHKLCKVISYFCTRNWSFNSSRVRSMLQKMTEEDQKLFFCDLKKLNWEAFFKSYVIGLRVYLIGDPLDTLEAGKVRARRLYFLHQAVMLLVSLLVLKVLWAIFSWLFF